MVFCTRGVIVLVCQRGSGDSLFKCTDKLRSGRTSRGNRHAESSPNAYNRAIGTGQVHERDGTIRMTTDKFEPRIEDTVVERFLANHCRFLDFLTARVGKRETPERRFSRRVRSRYSAGMEDPRRRERRRPVLPIAAQCRHRSLPAHCCGPKGDRSSGERNARSGSMLRC